MTPYEAAAVLAAFERADDYETLMWRVDMAGEGRGIKLFALCSDFFHLATADCEEIEATDIPLLEQCLADMQKAGDVVLLAELFAARKRKMRPHKGVTKGMTEASRALFDACSTEEGRAEVDRRDRDFWLAVAHKIKTDEAGAS